ncbi:chromosome segregation SMC family protein [Sphingosinicella sp. CPCC 101087]|uniref:chromosome segregation SMC family protein n=1 Tax=Sphingosinicella sp. CPCC 101087 TaxID=2497754 RepID=UPI00101B8DF6|nr:AAA family ATPase [Sphingosinicella sp. CPCC 101087]
MQVKRLKLSGFKSFVEPAELRVEPGLTGIVGPNGCGKSNVLEAIRWVMGESSAKSMRGAGMDDVIFAGTALRPSRDFAEVSMLVERQAEDVGGDASVPAGEVEITRRIERGAGSAYRVNGRDVRAKDVALLFADAATGAHSPALVSQGKISAVIAAKPTERRLLLEEAAGISGLHVRRKDAEQKLRAAETNLTRIDEMLSDMEQRGAALKRQARAAERYRKLSEQIRIAEGRLVYARWKEAAEAAEAAKKEAQVAETAVQRTAEAQRAAAAWQNQAATELADKRKAAEAARERASELGHRLATLRAERDTVRRRIDELADRRSTLAADRMREEALRADAAAALTRLDEELAGIANRLADAERRRGTIEIRTVELQDSAREAESALGKARAVQAAEQAEARVAQAALETARQKLARVEAEARKLEEQIGSLGDEAPLVEALEAARTRRKEAEARLEQAGEAIGAAEASRQQAAAARDAAESEAAAARAALAALQSEAKSLVKALENSGGDRAINHVKAEAGYERALAAALGDDLDAALGDDGTRRWAGAEPADDDPNLPPGCERLSDRVQAPSALLRRLRQIAVADGDDGSALLAVGQRLVTREGRLRRWDGYIATGLGAAAAERLIRVNRLAEIEAALPRSAAAVEAAEERTRQARVAMDAARDAADAARRSETQAAAAIREANRDEDAATVEMERLELRRTGLAERAQRAQADVGEARRSFDEAESLWATLPDPAVTETRVAELRAAAEKAQQALAEVRAEAATHARAVSADRQRAEAATQEQAEWRTRVAEAEKRHEAFGRRIAEAEAEAQRLAEAPEDLERRLQALTNESIDASEAAQAAAAHERDGEERLRQAGARLAEAAEALAAAREARAGAAARAENQESRRAEMARISGEKFECPPPLLPEKLGFAEAEIAEVAVESARLDRHVQERERIGPVNLVAETELAELEENRAASQAEREELGVAIHRLRGSIGSLNREGRARLLTAFQEVDRHFRSLFTTLFEGGQAHLELVESDDPLEAGLEIMAQPPGKRLSALTLLSGGEQALTAVALIFALFLTNPAPICVLDEVDAPLDDANIERFCDLLDRMVGETETRYLIVTHNAVTMSRMHRLFGVTMIEKGVSRLVSVDLGGAEKLLAAE